MIYIGIVGSRKRSAYRTIRAILIGKMHQYGKDNITVVSGKAKGIDTDARIVAHELGLPIIEFEPNYDEWNTKNVKIYFERNEDIARKSDELHAFPLGRKGGTMNTVNQFIELGKEDKLFIYD